MASHLAHSQRLDISISVLTDSPTGSRRNSQRRRSSIIYDNTGAPVTHPEHLLTVALGLGSMGGQRGHGRVRRFSQLATSISSQELKLPECCSGAAPLVPLMLTCTSTDTPKAPPLPPQRVSLEVVLHSPSDVDSPSTPRATCLPHHLQKIVGVTTTDQVSSEELAQADAFYQALGLSAVERLSLQQRRRSGVGYKAMPADAAAIYPPCTIDTEGGDSGGGSCPVMQPDTPDGPIPQLRLPALARQCPLRSSLPSMHSMSSNARMMADAAAADCHEFNHSCDAPAPCASGPHERRLQFRRSSLHLSDKGMDKVVQALRRSYDTLPAASSLGLLPSSRQGLSTTSSFRGRAHRRLSSYMSGDHEVPMPAV